MRIKIKIMQHFYEAAEMTVSRDKGKTVFSVHLTEAKYAIWCIGFEG